MGEWLPAKQPWTEHAFSRSYSITYCKDVWIDQCAIRNWVFG